jgi:DNA-binding transcriptional regulator GbsR (MarR family)
MKLTEAKQEFIASWGAFARAWNVVPNMGQIHAYLLLQDEPKTTDDIQEELHISRGHVYSNLAELESWGLIERRKIAGDRKDGYVAEKSMDKICGVLIRERKKRELEPMLKMCKHLEKVEERGAEAKRFTDQIKDIQQFAGKVDTVLDLMVRTETSPILRGVAKLFL